MEALEALMEDFMEASVKAFMEDMKAFTKKTQAFTEFFAKASMEVP